MGPPQQSRGSMLKHYTKCLPLGHLLMLSYVPGRCFIFATQFGNGALKGQVLKMKNRYFSPQTNRYSICKTHSLLNVKYP